MTSRGVEQTVDLPYYTDDYKLVLGISFYDTGCKGEPCYKLVNTRHHIVEGESISLPDAVASLLNRQALLDQTDEAYQAGVVLSPTFTGETQH